MKGLQLLALNAALSAMLIVAAAAEVDAQRQPAGSGPRNSIPSGGGQSGMGGATGVGGVGDHDGRGDRDGRGHKRDGDVFLIDEDVVEVVEVEKEAKPAEAAAAVPAAAPAVAEEKREPYKIGNSYDSLPPGCMKLIQDGSSYYFCGGAEWYQSVGGGQYKAVEQP